MKRDRGSITHPLSSGVVGVASSPWCWEQSSPRTVTATPNPWHGRTWRGFEWVACRSGCRSHLCMGKTIHSKRVHHHHHHPHHRHPHHHLHTTSTITTTTTLTITTSTSTYTISSTTTTSTTTPIRKAYLSSGRKIPNPMMKWSFSRLVVGREMAMEISSAPSCSVSITACGTLDFFLRVMETSFLRRPSLRFSSDWLCSQTRQWCHSHNHHIHKNCSTGSNIQHPKHSWLNFQLQACIILH